MDFRSSPDIRSEPNIRDNRSSTVQSQYANAKTINALVSGKKERLDPWPDIGLFFRDVFDIRTARGVGLDIWGRILGISRNVQLDDTEVLGFSGSGLLPFDQGVFNPGGSTKTYPLADDRYRQLLIFKALANISSTDAATINRLMSLLFAGRTIAVLEIGVMAIRYLFPFRLKDWERSLFMRGGALARGAGVRYEFLEYDPERTFGFRGSNLSPFGQGTFSPGPSIMRDTE